MFHYTIRFITAEDEVNIQLTSETIEDLGNTQFVQDLLHCTCVDSSGKSRCFALKVSPYLKNIFGQLGQKYGKALPKFNAVVALMNRTAEGKIFLVAFNISWNVFIDTQIKCIIDELEGGAKAKDSYDAVVKNFGGVLEQYQFICSDPNKFLRIGEQDRKKRVCRFCGKRMPETTFSNDSHTISEAFGNKNFITNDECDQCNRRFGEGDGIENDLLNMHAPLLTMLGVKGKKHIPEFTGKEFEVKYNKAPNSVDNPTVAIKLVVGNVVKEENDALKSIKLESDKRVVPQNVYRTLCKYAIGMLPNKYLDAFAETIKWINGEFDITSLPLVKFWLMQKRVTHPTLNVAIRISDEEGLPYAYAEFAAVCFRYMYIIPLANNEKTDFTRQENYERWWNLLTYAHGFPWREDNLSSSVSRKMTFNFNFHKR